MCSTPNQPTSRGKPCPWHHVTLGAGASGFTPSTFLSSTSPAVSSPWNKREKAGLFPKNRAAVLKLVTQRFMGVLQLQAFFVCVPEQLLWFSLAKASIISFQTQMDPWHGESLRSRHSNWNNTQWRPTLLISTVKISTQISYWKFFVAQGMGNLNILSTKGRDTQNTTMGKEKTTLLL